MLYTSVHLSPLPHNLIWQLFAIFNHFIHLLLISRNPQDLKSNFWYMKHKIGNLHLFLAILGALGQFPVNINNLRLSVLVGIPEHIIQNLMSISQSKGKLWTKKIFQLSQPFSRLPAIFSYFLQFLVTFIFGGI